MEKRHYLYCIIPILLFFAVCCTNSKPELHKIEIFKEYSQLSDSTILFNISCIEGNDDYLFFAMNKMNKILCMNRNSGKIEKILGRPGQGPGEFSGIHSMTEKNGYLYALSDGNKTINVFDIGKGKLINVIKVPDIFGPLKFAVDDDKNIYYSRPLENSIITKVNFNGEIIDTFGIPYKHADPAQNIYNNYGNVFSVDSTIIYIFIGNNPIIQIFSIKGSLIKTIDLRDDYFIARRIKHTRKSSHEDKQRGITKATYCIFLSCCVKDSKAYVTIGNKIKNKRYFYLYEISITTGDICNRYMMPDSVFYYSNGYIDDNGHLFLYDGISCNVHEYVINKQ